MLRLAAPLGRPFVLHALRVQQTCVYATTAMQPTSMITRSMSSYEAVLNSIEDKEVRNLIAF